MSAPPAPYAAALLLAAGSSTRMAGARVGQPRKPFLELSGQSILARALAAFEASPCVARTWLVVHALDLDSVRSMQARGELGAKLAGIVSGGLERTDSVRAGMAAVAEDCAVVLVHDVARPFVRVERIEAVAQAAWEHGAALLATPMSDTIKRSTDGLFAAETLARAELWSAHTPQAFRSERLRAMLARASEEGFKATDDAALHERYFGPVRLVQDDASNWKLTTPADLRLAEAWLAQRDRL